MWCPVGGRRWLRRKDLGYCFVDPPRGHGGVAPGRFGRMVELVAELMVAGWRTTTPRRLEMTCHVRICLLNH